MSEEMNKAIEKIGAKVKEYQEILKKKMDFLKNIEDASKKLESDKETTIGEINALRGAIHGHSEALKELQPEEKVDG